uniref:Small ribosomal subunit protein uS15c n=3 Tax=Cyphia TaxID=16404 RepID=A0A291F2I2_9ASTR|nr:ribosomal protein S15 [Cyphia angustiloba]YP_009436182.1 ribosomal protein S15 [Cyphia angustiloba]YP_009436365.1 ribosomal protein S15 [Cyphia belfastica]YP_009436380.1 ribosomal protein S15 [Cyphia belfastica]YP_009436965.1 ribosomal protein S15 [Cyphia tortilis]YP_009436980.1 ribosomal protein S15 [Cyphia tortilis]ATG26345.1 ribosomal protein S15 [Cyphia angustiloba]ATG26360.1 ribosomal protein S15 [Cyphia angustiloba]ATG26543.1 ribosomal protein S15 [Cyphia belfastica]ATG26558.1 rib
MVKNSFISIISQEENKENRGSVEFQVVSFINKIQRLTSHLKLHKKDYSSQRGMQKILGKHHRLLAYLSKKTRVHYKEFKELIDQLEKKETRVHYKEFKELIDQLEKKTR